MVTQSVLRTHGGKKVENNIPFVTAFNLIICLNQIKIMRLLVTCPSISKLPSNTSTMGGLFPQLCERGELELEIWR